MQYCYYYNSCTLLLRTSSDTDRLLLHDSCAKKLGRVISGLYQENYRKFEEAYVLILGMKPNATSKFSGHCFVHNFI